MGTILTYKEKLQEVMLKLSMDGYTFLGYNTVHGHKMYSTLDKVHSDKIIEMPVAENLMTGIGIGMALNGDKCCLCFERHDFMLLALDQIVNHLDKIEGLSHGEFKAPLMIRAVVGSTSPLNPGVQHKGEYTEQIRSMVSFPVYEIKHRDDFVKYYHHSKEPVIFVEYKDMYETSVESLPLRGGRSDPQKDSLRVTQ